MLFQKTKLILGCVASFGIASSTIGCLRQSVQIVPATSEVPRELTKMSHPAYIVEPPDVLQIELIGAVPKAPYKLRPLDVVTLSVTNTLPDSPISGPYSVTPEGQLTLGPPYGSISVAGMTTDEAQVAIEKFLSETLKKPLARLSLLQLRATQQIRGPHLVRADGTVGLGVYGQVRVVGMTVPEVKAAVEQQLQKYFQDPEVSIEVVGYNSKLYYVVFDYGGAGQQIIPQPTTGNETVLDAISKTSGLPTVADASGIWVARPSPTGEQRQMLPVDWKAVVERGDSSTNYQLLPGDRVFVKAYDVVAADNKLARLIAPVERVLGVVLLGSSTVNSIRTNPNNLNGINGR